MTECLLSYDTLKSFCWQHGYHADIHRDFDAMRAPPGRRDACWYLQPALRQGATVRTTLLKFATAAEVYDYILATRKTGIARD